MIAEIKGSLLRIEQQEPLIQGTVGQTLGVRLSEEWAGLTVTAVFSAGSVARDVAVTGDGLVIPWELLAEPEHTLFLNFHGAAPGGSPVRRTNIASLGTVEKSRSPSGTGPDAPSPSRADQIQALAEQALSLAQGVRSDADSGLFNGRDGADGLDGLSPSISVSKTGDTAVITVTDASGSASVSVKDGREIDPEKVWGAYPVRSASGAHVQFEDGADGIPVRSLVVDIDPVQTGSGNPSPDNIRPISGWTGVNVTRTGKNLFDESVMATASGWTEDNGVYTGSSDYLDRNAFGFFLPSLFPLSQQLTLSFDINNETNRRAGYFYFLYSDGTTSHVECPANAAWVHKALTTTPGKEITAFYFGKSNGTTFSLKNVQLEFGTSESLFETYQGNTRSVSWQSEAGTVYGGTLDVTSGLLTVNKLAISKAVADMNNSESYPGWKNVAELDALGLSTTRGNFTADAGNIGLYFSWNTDANILFLSTGHYGKTQSQWQSEYPDLSVLFVCPLAAPQTYLLTPTEIKTLLGVNNIWADTGESAVDYRADPTLYLDRRLTASRSVIAGVESGFTASRNYAAGSLLIVGDTLYKTTSAIENGGAIQPGMNAAATTVAEQLLLLAAQ